jgi:hypothetical protein
MIFTYRIGEKSIDLMLFGIILVRPIPFSTISDISVEKAWTLKPRFNPFRTERLGNRPSLRMVVIRRHKGWARTILMTPRAPEEFVADVKAKLAQIKG